jgi:hypothetical protein
LSIHPSFSEYSLISLDSQHPDALAQIQTLESKTKDSVSASGAAEAEATAQPAFAQHMTDKITSEGDSVTLECKVTPVKDPNLKIGKGRRD